MGFHDARLISIELKDNHSAVIALLDDCAAKHEVFFEQLDRMRCIDFCEGNIVLDVLIYSGTAPPIDVLEKLFAVTTQKEIPAYLDVRIKRIEAGELTLVHILPSYGAELIALCGGLHITQIKASQ
jgi:hypothetical protein